MDDNEAHPWNAFLPMDVSEGGKVTDSNAIHPRKVSRSIVVIFDGMTIDTRDEQYWNAEHAILVMVEGSWIDLRCSHL